MLPLFSWGPNLLQFIVIAPRIFFCAPSNELVDTTTNLACDLGCSLEDREVSKVGEVNFDFPLSGGSELWVHRCGSGSSQG